MWMKVKLETPLSRDDIKNLNVGDIVYISGTIFTARDRAHERIIRDGAPYDLEGTVIFHAGPIIRCDQLPEDETIDNPPAEIVAVGPTTSSRMNPYGVKIVDMGVRAIIGKGGMDENTKNSLVKNYAVYLAAVGGCAALYAKAVKRIIRVHWPDLGVAEAIWELEVEDFGPLVVAIDSSGEDLYERLEKRRRL